MVWSVERPIRGVVAFLCTPCEVPHKQVRRRRQRRPPPGERGDRSPAEHTLLAPTLLRSQTLSALHEAVQRGEIPADLARDHLARIGRMPIRLLGDAVLRRRAWTSRISWAGPRPTPPSTLRSPNCRQTRRDPRRGTRSEPRRDRRDRLDRRAALGRQRPGVNVSAGCWQPTTAQSL